MTSLRPALAALLILATAPAFAQSPEAYALPDPTMTPGAVDAHVSLDVICNGTTRSRRAVTLATRDKVFADYGIAPVDRWRYELDHDVPLALGGTNAAANLWPEPQDEATLKDALEVTMQRRACVAYRTLVPAEAAAVLATEQREIAEDWPAAYRRYTGR